MFGLIYAKINNYLETMLERVSLRKVLITLLIAFVSLAMLVFVFTTYKTIYKTIYKERIAKLKYIDDFAMEILKYQDSLVQKHQKTLAQAQKESIEMIRSVRFENNDYIWIDSYEGASVFHPIPDRSSKFTVDSKIRAIVKGSGKGYLQYRWAKVGENKKKEYDKVSFVEGYKNWGWIVGTGVYVDDIGYLVAKSILDGILPVLLFLIFMTILLRFLVLKSIVQPIDKLADISLRLANNDLDVTLPKSESNTEMGKLYKVFNKFVQLFKTEKRAAERESLLRAISEKIRSSLNLDETLFFICEETAKLFNAQRSAIATYADYEKGEGYAIRKEYKISPELQGFTYGEDFAKTAYYWSGTLANATQALAIDNIEKSDAPDYFKNIYKSMGIKSIIGTAIRKENNVWGTLVLSEYNVYRHWTEEEKTLLNSVADQIYIAINQAELFEAERKLAKNERLIANVISKAISTFDINQIKQLVREVGTITKADRCYFVEVEEDKLQGKQIDYEGEYLASPDIKTIIGYNFSAEDVKKFIEMYMNAKDLLVFDYEKISANESELYEGINRYSSRFDLKSGIGIPFIYRDKLVAVLCIEYVKEKVLPSESELNFLRILGNQIKMAYRQIQLYQNTKRTAEKESFLRKIFEAMRSSLDINIIKNTIVKEVGRVLNSDRCFILTFAPDEDYFFIDNYSEYLAPGEDKSFVGFDARHEKVKWFIDRFRKNEEVDYSDLGEFVVKNNLHGSSVEAFLYEYNIQSGYNISIYYANKLLGYIILHYTKKSNAISETDLAFLRIIATQAGIALHQANLYKITQTQAETEKFNRKILEILRNTLDKNTIKHLFVVNIGKYFNADRVFFVDYDSKRNVYIPIDSYSEYLSGPEEKSFVGLDWSDASLKEYIRPLLEKREMKISCWDDYIQANQNDEGFVSRFKDAGVKSSYNFPVIHEGKIMGYFCIEFTKDMCVELNDEEINRIRSMCTQAAVALYNSDLFAQARAIANSKNILISKVDDSAIKLLNEVEILSEEMSDVDVKCSKHQLRQNQIDEILKNLKYFITNILEADKEAKDES